MRALLVYQSVDLPSSRIRILQMAPHLVREGLEVHCVPHPRGAAERRQLRQAMEAHDVVVVQKKVPRGLARMWWRRCPKPVVYDFDDAIMFRDRPPFESRRRRRRFDEWVLGCDGIVCGNDYLASQCPAASPPRLVAASPVPHDVPQRVERERERLQVGWVGGGKNLPSLEAVLPALAELAQTVAFDLVIISDRRLDTGAVPVVHRQWSLEQQEEWIADLDVGLMPLEDSPWSRGKCAYKALQYMAAAVPVVATPVGMNAQLIEHESNGLLAEDLNEWTQMLARLSRDGALRERLGAAGRNTVEMRFTYDVIAARWAEFLREVVEGRA